MVEVVVYCVVVVCWFVCGFVDCDCVGGWYCCVVWGVVLDDCVVCVEIGDDIDCDGCCC